ncbi:MAG: GNAT family N-acetyltransferase, partial [Alphaproteobacteria bacterium]|nr:GNAT family N-acetyltransferase [Alphaproteobacteria bacterium]
QDAPALQALYTVFFEEEGIEINPARQWQNLIAMIRSPNSKMLVAITPDDKLIGLVTATITRGVEFGACAEIEDLFVLKAYRGQGLAKHLMRSVIGFCQDQGAEMVSVVVTLEGLGQNLREFYTTLNFVESDRTVFYKPLKTTGQG